MKNDHIISLLASVKFKADKFLVNELKKNGVKDLAPSHGGILNLLYQHNSLSMKIIADKIERDKSTVTTLVNKLIDLGYIEKEQDYSDRRIFNITLTKKGKSLKPIFEDISGKLIKETYKHFSDKEKKSIINLLEKMNKNW